MKKSLRYSVAAMVMAFAVIGTTLYANSIWGPPTVKGQTNFLVILTDPPNVPKGTTKLEVTYSEIQLHVIPSNGPSNWVDTQASGKVDLLSLVDVEQTIASADLSTGSIIDKLQFTISSAKATIDGVVYPATILTDKLVVSLRGVKLTGTTVGALIDLRPTLVRINAFDVNGEKVSYYVLVPSATAIIKTNLHEDQKHVGAKSHLHDDENEELEEEYQKTSKDMTISGVTLKVQGDTTKLSVTLKNTGTRNIIIRGLTINGDFSFSNVAASNSQGEKGKEDDDENDHPRTIPFMVTDDKLVPRISNGENDEHGNDNKGLELAPQETKTLTFNGIIQLHPNEHGKAPAITITPIKGNEYTIRIVSQGSQTFEVTAS